MEKNTKSNELEKNTESNELEKNTENDKSNQMIENDKSNQMIENDEPNKEIENDKSNQMIENDEPNKEIESNITNEMKERIIEAQNELFDNYSSITSQMNCLVCILSSFPTQHPSYHLVQKIIELLIPDSSQETFEENKLKELETLLDPLFIELISSLHINENEGDRLIMECINCFRESCEWRIGKKDKCLAFLNELTDYTRQKNIPIKIDAIKYGLSLIDEEKERLYYEYDIPNDDNDVDLLDAETFDNYLQEYFQLQGILEKIDDASIKRKLIEALEYIINILDGFQHNSESSQ